MMTRVQMTFSFDFFSCFCEKSSAVRQSGIAAFSLFSELIPHVGICSIFANAEIVSNRHFHGTPTALVVLFLREVLFVFASPLLKRYKRPYCSVDFALHTKDLASVKSSKSLSICIHQDIAEVTTYKATSQVTTKSLLHSSASI
jgi:hypothetical protein